MEAQDRENDYELDFAVKDNQLTKQKLWERKLLDLSLRNNLLNTKFDKSNVIELTGVEQDVLEDKLFDGEAFHIVCSEPKDASGDATKTQAKAETKDFSRERTLSTHYSQERTLSELNKLYRTSRSMMEENGSNSLYVALGFVKWIERDNGKKSRGDHYAPMMLIPVTMSRHGSKFSITGTGEDTIFNVSLIELFKQVFSLDVKQILPLPEDEHGVDVQKVTALMKEWIKDEAGWEVVDKTALGIFSFSKFVMWRDIHEGGDVLRANPLVSSLINGVADPLLLDSEASDAAICDETMYPDETAIAMDVDSSQLEAVVDAGKGKSFILHGPPGTGKSQTITNMIVNALYHGKRVLFVSEKMAALEVVKKRLDKVGLAPFCLELHSNKATKKHVLEQLSAALDAPTIQPPQNYIEDSNALFDTRAKMINNMKSLHTIKDCGYSLHDCISSYMLIDGAEIPFQSDKVKAEKGVVESIAESVRTFADVIPLIGHPAQHGLKGLELKQYQPSMTDNLRGLLEHYANAISIYKVVFSFANGELQLGLAETLENIPVVVRLIELLRQRVVAETAFFIVGFFKKMSLNKVVEAESDIMQKYYYQATLKITDYKAWSVINAPTLNAIVSGHETLCQYKEALSNYLCFEWTEAETCANAIQMLNGYAASMGSIKNWWLWTSKKRDVIDAGAGYVVDYFMTSGLDPQAVADAFMKGFFKYAANSIIDSDEKLQLFSGTIFEQVIERYKRAVTEFQEDTRKMVFSKLASNVPSLAVAAVNGSLMGFLRRAIASQGRGLSIRRIIYELRDFMPRLCPCMLMSPISVAQYLSMNMEKFDLVIFDEASQMPTSEAVGSIARAKNLVVVGDPKQMPPTSFFSNTHVDEDEAEYDDLDSILDDCLAVGLPSKYLTWHYRSRHESLIAFSNSQYYDGKLFTFPSVDDSVSKVSYVPVQGTYDKGHSRSNRAEAEAVVAEIKRRLLDKDDNRSVGVVAFSKAQQDLIEDVLFDEFVKSPQLEKLANEGEEPIFIKNLENVQGDERDVILFSVGYGPDKDGKVSMNFGPLNNSGGERRLNVAVTRSRTEMVVFSSMRSDMIDLNRTNALGVVGLKMFLKFAELGSMSADSGNDKANERSLVSDVALAIENMGYKVVRNVGRSNFKIDIAVEDPCNNGKYLLGILCDGKGYYAAKTVRDREVVRPNVLGGLGWNLMKVWAMDWFFDKDETIALIAKNLEALKQDPSALRPNVYSVKPFTVEGEPIVENVNKYEKRYVKYSASRQLKDQTRMDDVVDKIIDAEAPIRESMVVKRATELFGLARTNSTITAAIKNATFRRRVTTDSDGVVVFWKDNIQLSTRYPFYRVGFERDVKDIPDCEIEAAIMYIVECQLSIQIDDLARLSAQQLGFSRRGQNLQQRIDSVLAGMLSLGRLKEKDGRVSE